MISFDVVRQFEKRVAEFAGAKYAVAMNTCTSALFLSLKYAMRNHDMDTVILPAHTFISVPMAAIQAGLTVKFEDYPWQGIYRLEPFNVIDGALRFKKGMYEGGLHCLSFHARKLLNIGEGGMVLTDDPDAAAWLRKACYSGRGEPSYRVEDIEMMGWQYYMTPEKAARGLHLMEYVEPWPDQLMEINNYPDLRKVPAFKDKGIHKLANVVGDLTVGENCRIDPFVTITGNVKLGNNVHIGVGACIFGAYGVEIGDDCSISPGAKIFTSTYDSETAHRANPQLRDKEYCSGPVTIGNRCIVGANSVVLPNVELGDDVLVGCQSLVKTSLTKGLYADVPVREIHKQIH